MIAPLRGVPSSLNVQDLPIKGLTPNPHNARTHSKRQINQLVKSIETFGFVVPIVVDENGMILAGHARCAAATQLGWKELPAVVTSGLSAGKRRALALSENKISQNGGWDREILAAELSELSEILIQEDLDISITAFLPAEIDVLSTDLEPDSSDPVDEIDPKWVKANAVTRPGDLWSLDRHRLLCGDARSRSDLELLMNGQRAAMAFLDPPYNVKIRDVVGRGKIKHMEFAMASGEMPRDDFIKLLGASFEAAASVSTNGAVHYSCIDWRHISELLQAAAGTYSATLNLIVWVKSNAGQGSFYRSQYELIGVFRVGDAQYQNNIELGRHGRHRSNVWHYPGVNTFRAGRLDDLKSHPTVKPTALVADAIKDCTGLRDVVIDTFCGSGTTILAAERVGRTAYGLEIEPRFIDIAIRRWQAFTRKDAIHAATGRCFDQLAIERV